MNKNDNYLRIDRINKYSILNQNSQLVYFILSLFQTN